jgi:hypothetical protein
MEIDDLVELDNIRNRVLLLYAMNELEHYGNVDKWKIQKTCFFAQYDAQSKRIKSTSYQFFKWKQGPMSTGIVGDLDVFNATGLVQLQPNRAFESVTEEGKELVSQMAPIVEAQENQAVIDHLNGWIHHLGPFTGERLKDWSHQCLVPYRDNMTPINDIPDGTPLLFPIKARNISFDLTIPKEWIRTLGIVFSYRYAEIKRTLTSTFKESDLLSWSEVFGTE